MASPASVMVVVGSSPDATLNSARLRDSQTAPISGFIDYGLQGIPQPSVPEMGAVWESLGLAEFKVASGEDPTTTMTEAGDAISATIAAQ